MEDKTRKDKLQAVWFAAGSAVLIACIERAVVVSIFKQWHMWVFLALNLLLIAILFTSTHPPRNHSNLIPKSHSVQETGKKQPPQEVAGRREDAFDDGGNLGNEEREESFFSDDEDDDGEKSSSLLSNEELNERVEAFISRFRQQYLVSDVKIGRSRSGNVCERAVFSKSMTV
ncbi:hypothetical protein R6Q57_001331 [Mikania cordata]